MTVWMLHLEDPSVTGRNELPLPFEGMPDFTGVTSMGAYRLLIQQAFPDLPPESMKGMLERSWERYSAIHAEDIIALPTADGLAIAEVTGDYRYDNGAHWMSVQWLEKRVPLRALRKYPEILRGNALEEINDPQLRTLIRDRLPHGYNRFARWKWLLGAMVGLQAVAMLSHYLQQN